MDSESNEPNEAKDEVHPRVMIVVGRFSDVNDFVEAVGGFLYDNFDIVAAQPLEVEDERDFLGNLRFIGFVSGKEMPEMTLDKQAKAIKSSGGVLGATVHDSMKDAMDWATEKFDWDNGKSALAAAIEKSEEMVKKFTNFTVDEIEFGVVFKTMMEASRLNIIRGLIDDEPVMVMALVTSDGIGETLKINPMAVLLTKPDLRKMVELPFSTED